MLRDLFGRNGAALGMAFMLAWTTGCPSQGVEEEETGNGGGVGAPCSVDGDCDGTLCLGGICTAPASSSSGVSSSSSSSSSGATSSTSGGASSEIPDAGMPDAYVPRGIIETSPATGPIEFGAQRIGQAVEKTVVVTNTGDAAFSIVQVGIRYATGSVNAGEFTIVPVGTQPTSLAPEEQFALRIIHTPVDGIPDNAFLSIVTTAANTSNLELALVAEFKGDSVLAVHEEPDGMGANVTTLLVGAAPVGGMVTKTIYVRNLGAADSALTVQTATLTPATQTQFSVGTGPLPRGLSSFPGTCMDASTCSAPATACTGQLCTVVPGGTDPSYPLDAVRVDVTFNASQEGEANATLTLVGQSSAGPFEHVVSLLAAGQTGSLTVEPMAIDFGEVFINRPAERTVRLSNTGMGLLSVDSVSWLFNLPEFELDTAGVTFPRNIGPMGYVEFTVRFTPGSVGGFNNMLQVVLPNRTQQVQVTGTGALEPEISTADTLDFGPVYVGTARQLPLAVNNVANGLLRINRAYVEAPGNPNPPFTFSPTTFADPVERNIPLNIQVTYAPQVLQAALPDTAQLVIETNDPDTPLRRVSLVGRTVQPIATVVPSPTTLDFGAILNGASSAPRAVTVRNLGVGDLTITSDLVVRDTASAPRTEYALTTLLRGQPIPAGVPVTISAGGADTATFTFVFTPTSTMPLAATLRITTNDPNLQNIDVNLVGSGGDCPPRANAGVTVNPMTGACQYTCNNGYHACGDTCRADNDADACGAACVRCDTRSNSNRTCSAGACAYACQNTFYDLNPVDLSVAQGASSNGCEYQCAVSNPGAEVCDNLDNNCNGRVDDGLPLESPEPPSTCSASATNLGDILDNNTTVTFTGYKMYPDGDTDWFRFVAKEDEFNFCVNGEPYRTTIKLEGVPSTHDYDLQVYRGSCGSGSTATSQAGAGSDETVVITWTGSCGGDDDEPFYFRVYAYPSGTGAGSCFPYTLKITHDRT